jgi:hypothetical protein
VLGRDTAAPSAGVNAVSTGGSSKLIQLLRKRLRQLAIIAAALFVVLAISAASIAIWWLTSLNGLPDIGDPFDVSAWRAVKLPEEQNACTYYRRAQESLSPFPDLPRTASAGAATVAWSKADPKLREWAGANGAALRWFLKGADQADGVFVPGPKPDPKGDAMARTSLASLALLEGGRREEAGDMEGAWTHYRAVLRMASLLSRRMGVMDRLSTNIDLRGLRSHLQSWAADPRSTIPQLRQALDEVKATGIALDLDALSLKQEYLAIMQLLDDPNGYLEQGQGMDLVYRFEDMQLPHNAAARLYAARRFLIREPDRSRRIIRLVFANWLARHKIPPENRPKAAVKVVIQQPMLNTALPLYPVDPDAPAGVRIPLPQEIAKWLVTSHDARLVLGNVLRSWVRLEERQTYRTLLINLAGELYRRERGTYPASDEALIGTYLDRFPDDPAEDFSDPAMPMVSD